MARDNTWTNEDGLVVGFGTRTPASSAGAKTNKSGAVEEVTMKIVGTDLADTVAATSDAIVHGPTIPQDAYLLDATLFVTTAFTSGGSAVLDIGVYEQDGSIVDDDGIDAAIAVATLVDNYDVSCDGADVGTVVTTSGGVKIGASYDTAAFTAGEATLVVRYIPEAA